MHDDDDDNDDALVQPYTYGRRVAGTICDTFSAPTHNTFCEYFICAYLVALGTSFFLSLFLPLALSLSCVFFLFARCVNRARLTCLGDTTDVEAPLYLIKRNAFTFTNTYNRNARIASARANYLIFIHEYIYNFLLICECAKRRDTPKHKNKVQEMKKKTYNIINMHMITLSLSLAVCVLFSMHFLFSAGCIYYSTE